jgi:RNA polymerase sigma-70 factor (ECF subfamily)
VGVLQPDAFEVWYQRTYPRLFTSMLGVCGDREVAVEVADEAFARAWSHWDRVHEMEAPDGWTYRVALNLVRTRARRSRVEQRLLPRLVQQERVDAPGGEVWELVRALPPRQRIAIVLRYVGDLDERHIAKAMNVTRGSVASTLAAARRTLGAALRDDHVVEDCS